MNNIVKNSNIEMYDIESIVESHTNPKLINNNLVISGGLFGQKPATGGFGTSFGAPASSAATGFSGLGSFTPATGKQTKNLKHLILLTNKLSKLYYQK